MAIWQCICGVSTGTTHIKNRLGMLAYKHMTSPIGRLKLVADGAVSSRCSGPTTGRIKLYEMHEDPHHPLLAEAERQLVGYFKGERTASDLPSCSKERPFRKSLATASAYSDGETRSYGQLALAIGNGSASRAVGLANARTLCPSLFRVIA